MNTNAVSTDRDADLESFRLRARRWLAEHARPVEEAPPLGRSDAALWQEARLFQKSQHEAGFAGITWPKEYGGQGLPPEYQAAFNAESEPYYLPSSSFTITLAILGMALLDHGTEEQKRRYLPEMLRGEALWVQLLSEPAAGSDLAASRMRAERDGDEWVLTGEKVWSSFAQWSDYAMVLARTDWEAPKHAGLTMFIVPLDAEGLTIRPLRQISGDDEFCQEFLDEVRVPESDVLGGIGRGWAVATSLFNHSRNMTGGSADTAPVFDKTRGGDPDPGRHLIDAARRDGRAGDPEVRGLIAELVADNVVSGLLSLRVSRLMQREGTTPALGTMTKLFGCSIVQRRYDIELALQGEDSMAWSAGDERGPSLLHDYLWGRTATVAGGTHEVNLNTIGERVLGLPGERPVDRDRPFREVISAPRR